MDATGLSVVASSLMSSSVMKLVVISTQQLAAPLAGNYNTKFLHIFDVPLG